MVRKDLASFIKTIPSDITVVAATKYVNSEDLLSLLKNGINNFGENRVEAFLNKYNEIASDDITWHFIGHLQRNKAKLIANKIDYLHSLDSIELAKLLNKLRTKPLACFIEVSVNNEENKNGVEISDLPNFILEVSSLPNIKIVGLMMMTIKNSDDESQILQFEKLRNLRDQLEKDLNITLPYLSMGMSEDYLNAIKCGATHIRLGRILFDML